MTNSSSKTVTTVTHAFLNQVRTQPDTKIFHVKDGTSWTGYTWKNFYDEVSSIALGLLETGIQPEDKVCILSNTRYEWAQADMAILAAKGITVPIYASNTPEDCTYIFNHCEAKYIFVEDAKQLNKILSIKNNLPQLKKIFVFPNASQMISEDALVITLDSLKKLGQNSSLSAKEDVVAKNLLSVKPTDTFTICYTSGTTGVPKGVVLLHDSLISVVEDIMKIIDFSDNDTILSFLPMSHIFGKVEAMAAYYFSWKIYYAENMDKLFTNIGEVKPTILFAVPRVFEKAFVKIKAGVDDSSILKKTLFSLAQVAGKKYFGKIWAKQKPSLVDALQYEAAKNVVFKKVYEKFGGRLRLCIAGGAPLPREIGEFMQVIGIKILEGYGLTETCAAVIVNPLRGPKFGSIGKPLPEVQLNIAEDGEILIKSRKVMAGYFKNPAATREVLEESGWFHTGDIGIVDEDGYVKITDRKKDIIVTSAGKNIAPQKIENIAKSHKYINQIMVYGDRRNFLTALIVLDREETIKYAKEHGILFSEYSELVKNPKIIQLVQGMLDDINSHLASFESLKRFRILSNEFTIETGELTPSMKIKRRYCSDKYKAELEDMYS